MNYSIIPQIGIGPLRFGMTRSEVRNILQAPFISVPSKSLSSVPMEAFFENALQVFYQENGACEAIECYSHIFTVTLDGRSILGEAYTEVRNLLQSMDKLTEEDDCGITSYSLGIGVYAPDHTYDENATTESVIVFERGYYGRYRVK